MKLKHKKIFINKLFPLMLTLLAIIIAALYRNMFDNPFIHDDFTWLEHGRKIVNGDHSNIFISDHGNYFPAFLHFLFGLFFKLFGLNFTLYHIVSLLIHLANTLLLFWLICLLFNDYSWALLAAFFFAVNPIISNAVIWVAALMELSATLWFLISLISYKFFLDKGDKSLYIFAFIFFLMSIFTKVIGIGLPLILLFLEVMTGSYYNGGRYKQILKRLFPFFLAAICYLTLIALEGDGLIRREASIYNIFRYIPAMFVPEGHLTLAATIIVTVALFVFIISLYFRHKKEVLLILLLLVLSLMPLGVRGFSLKPVSFLDSISNRLYLPSIGSQMLLGLAISNIYAFVQGKVYKRLSFALIAVLCAIFLAWSFVKIDQREKAWDFESKNTFDLFQQLKSKEEKLSSNSLIYLINIPSSGAFWEPMVRLYYNNPSVNVIRYPHMPDFGRYTEVYIYLYIKGWLLNDHGSIMKMAKNIGIDDIGPVMKFYELKGWNNEKLELLSAISASAFDDAKMHYRLAQIYQDMKMLDNAETEYRTALIITPYDVETHYNLGLLYISKKQHDRGIEEFKFVVENTQSPLAPMAKKFIKYLESIKHLSGEAAK